MRPILAGAMVSRTRNSWDNPSSSSSSSSSSTSSPSSSTSTSTFTPTPTRHPLRKALQNIDQNAMMRVLPQKNAAPLKSNPGHPNPLSMPPSYDHNNKNNKSSATRNLPALSTTAKQLKPLTPRIANASPSGYTTPLSRRGPRPDTNGTPLSAASRDDISTPVSTFLNNNNITPRSGSRKTRAESPINTPADNPNGTSSTPSTIEPFRVHHDQLVNSGVGIAGVEIEMPKRPTVAFSPATSDIGHSSPLHPGAESKFFFASEVGAHNHNHNNTTRPQPLTKSTTFFYANGDSVPSGKPLSSSGSAVGSNFSDERTQPKFFHANGTPDIHTSPSLHLPPPKASSTVSSSSRITSPRLTTPNPGPTPFPRPASPQKLNQYASLSSLTSTPLPSPVLSRPQTTGRGQATNSSIAARRASIEATQKANHRRSSSGGPLETRTPARRISGGTPEPRSSTTSPNLIATPIPVSTPEEILEGSESIASVSPIEAQSPVKAGHSIEHMNELAANARRERKVLDLEITNSSLAAINRTLEREMRKQTAELRRYRRLSRSGRLSIATAASSRISTGALSAMDEEGEELAGQSDEDSENSETEDDFDLSEDEDSMDDGPLSPGAIAESDLRHRTRDEKRLQLDLSKHQQLLIDSQKMNQSLKRCLAWTEELINDGRKALAYNIRVSDVELGGRVLASDEVEDADDIDDNEGLSEIGASVLREARKAAARGTSAWGGVGKDDRDSGIELDVAQKDSGGGIFGAFLR